MLHTNTQFINCFVAIGGNQKNSKDAINNAILEMANHPQIHNLKSSRLYLTSPVSSIPQPHFLNSMTQFNTSLEPHQLLLELQSIEKILGKEKKNKDEPRTIDLDIIQYGSEVIDTEELTIPHPKWKERLFVLKPMSDLVDLAEMLENFNNKHGEVVLQLPDILPYQI